MARANDFRTRIEETCGKGCDPTVPRAVDVDDVGALPCEQLPERKDGQRQAPLPHDEGLHREPALLGHRHNRTARLQDQADVMTTRHQSFGVQ